MASATLKRRGGDRMADAMADANAAALTADDLLVRFAAAERAAVCRTLKVRNVRRVGK